MSDILVATDSAVILYEGERVPIHKGVTRVREGHPMLKGHEDLFKPIDVHYDIEDGTRRPGAKRTGKRAESKEKASAKSDED